MIRILIPTSTSKNFTKAVQGLMEDAILFKNELCEADDDYGPVRVRRGGEVTNYEDHPDLKSVVDGKPMPQWFSRTRAVAIADELKLPFQET